MCSLLIYDMKYLVIKIGQFFKRPMPMYYAQRERVLIACIFILLSIGLLFCGIQYFTLFKDECYQAICCRNWSRSPLAMMTFWIGNIWMQICGDNLFALRVLCRLSALIAVLVGALLIWIRTKNMLLASVCMFMGVLFNYLGDFQFYSWDTGAYGIEAVGPDFAVASP